MMIPHRSRSVSKTSLNTTYAFNRGNMVSLVRICEVTDFESIYFAPRTLIKRCENIVCTGPFGDPERSPKIVNSFLRNVYYLN